MEMLEGLTVLATDLFKNPIAQKHILDTILTLIFYCFLNRNIT